MSKARHVTVYVPYQIVLTSEGSGFLVTCPEFPNVTTFGVDEDAAKRAAVGAIEEEIARLIAADRYRRLTKM